MLIVNEQKFKTLEQEFRADGLAKIHILADFDKTLTQAMVNGQEVPSVISILRDGRYLTPDYAKKAHALYNKYHPREKDPNLSVAAKKKLMAQWWQAHFALLLKSGLNRKDVKRVVQSPQLQLRAGFAALADFLQTNKIPLVIISSGGLGEESISLKLKQAGRLTSNIHIISNAFLWNKDGRAVGVRQPIVHGANKDETLVRDFPAIFAAVKDRQNVILLGDSLGDIGMAEGFAYDSLLKIALLAKEDQGGIDAYKNIYDVLILNDGSLDFVTHFLRKI
ncbi:MAG: hypothetical protein COU85_00175 [Candidatus Portnoybacteria bacterium CG10_big_fil_rev_8_21_14_0_10_44_7]|uniref:5'-nucleotidase n=1 Tax=Candidatus Portnoybacteria bacterium CG10_big_fil_rev_8_21_14_0_10_44_7 TaxID=1974816 RepID=A0A2M8KJI8_9BACT|nr:MAG: hypothetical protein COU85_00175 [Candidatus Portnoybacteria bacterium CG10_big_fil_rev_8_21_14_0_10_44_7]